MSGAVAGDSPFSLPVMPHSSLSPSLYGQDHSLSSWIWQMRETGNPAGIPRIFAGEGDFRQRHARR
jgi:hypothetical protein